MLIYQ
jgi:hypothetical protein